jgi:hypothetical protein
MNLTHSKKIRFVIPERPGQRERELLVEMPTVGQTIEVLNLEPADDAARAKETPGERFARNYKQALVLIAPPEPEHPTLEQQAQHAAALDAARGMLNALTIGQLAQVFETLWLASQGYSLDKIADLATELAKKKATSRAMNALSSSRPKSSPSPKPATNSPANSGKCAPTTSTGSPAPSPTGDTRRPNSRPRSRAKN